MNVIITKPWPVGGKGVRAAQRILRCAKKILYFAQNLSVRVCVDGFFKPFFQSATCKGN